MLKNPDNCFGRPWTNVFVSLKKASIEKATIELLVWLVWIFVYWNLKTLPLAWPEWFSCKDKEWKIYCVGLALSLEARKLKFHVNVWQTTWKKCTKRVPHVQHDYFSTFNQSNHWFVMLWLFFLIQPIKSLICGVVIIFLHSTNQIIDLWCCRCRCRCRYHFLNFLFTVMQWHDSHCLCRSGIKMRSHGVLTGRVHYQMPAVGVLKEQLF